MKLNPRFYFLSLVALLFVLSFVVVPRGTKSADKDEDKANRSARTRPESKSREGAAAGESVRERDDLPTRVGAQPSSSRKPMEAKLQKAPRSFTGDLRDLTYEKSVEQFMASCEPLETRAPWTG